MLDQKWLRTVTISIFCTQMLLETTKHRTFRFTHYICRLLSFLGTIFFLQRKNSSINLSYLKWLAHVGKGRYWHVRHYETMKIIVYNQSDECLEKITLVMSSAYWMCPQHWLRPISFPTILFLVKKVFIVKLLYSTSCGCSTTCQLMGESIKQTMENYNLELNFGLFGFIGYTLPGTTVWLFVPKEILINEHSFVVLRLISVQCEKLYFKLCCTIIWY